ncbi:polysaccharide deacetylase family protein [Paenibacillus hexagrammi]|uniref:Polysaccharide deacetylase family protein n=1 Tax=Paenibacillus hexagrammi TaxID=2908839 RepID=A0ABY3SJ89_9BACL|nr:polysaccharide deacetylase family protein [Paenibacillus sp. YPD9-1]UJF33873.1 polysaccharide deacetylase family protein [Paenibacillus sp. YPD9-1]
MTDKMTLIIAEVATNRKAVAFTFDDEPDPSYTPQLLEIFRKAGAKATFFVVGEQVEAHPAIARSAYAEGHELANHTFTHPFLTQVDGAKRAEELERAEASIVGITGSKPLLFRPPYFDYDQETSDLVRSMGYTAIGANNTSARDWDVPGVEHILAETRKAVKSGSIFLFHDGYGDRSQTVEAVRILVSELQEQGYEMVTVSELLGMADPANETSTEG